MQCHLTLISGARKDEDGQDSGRISTDTDAVPRWQVSRNAYLVSLRGPHLPIKKVAAYLNVCGGKYSLISPSPYSEDRLDTAGSVCS
jgi:hypothetical protein